MGKSMAQFGQASLNSVLVCAFIQLFRIVSYHSFCHLNLGAQEREEVSRELVAAQMQGYRNEIMNQRRGRGQGANQFSLPRVREPQGGLHIEKKLDRELYRKRQAAGGGIPSGSIQANERNWNLTVSSLFCEVILGQG